MFLDYLHTHLTTFVFRRTSTYATTAVSGMPGFPLLYLPTVIMHFTSALAVYEYIITSGHEVETILRRQRTAPAILFLSTRWVMVLQAVIQLLPPSPQVSIRLSSRSFTDNRFRGSYIAITGYSAYHQPFVQLQTAVCGGMYPSDAYRHSIGR